MSQLERLYGLHAVRAVLARDPARVVQLAIADRRDDRRVAQVEALARAAGVAVKRVDAQALAKLAGEGVHQGVVAEVKPLPPWTEDALLAALRDAPAPLVLALDGVQDPHNLGAILRSAEFFGALGAIWPVDRAANLSAVVVRTSAGASERLPLARVTNLARALAACKDAGFWVIGTVVDGGRPLRELIDDGLPERVVVVLGSEETGLRRLTRESCDFLATIPRVGAIGSLNVSAAAAVTLSAVCMGTKER